MLGPEAQLDTISTFYDTVAGSMQPEKMHLHIGGHETSAYLRTLLKRGEVLTPLPREDGIAHPNLQIAPDLLDIQAAIETAPERIGSVSLTFILHLIDPETFTRIANRIPQGVPLSVLDYHLKGCTKEQFAEKFSNDTERAIIRREGIDNTYHTFTARGACDFLQMAQPLYCRESFRAGSKYFTWRGTRTRPN